MIIAAKIGQTVLSARAPVLVFVSICFLILNGCGRKYEVAHVPLKASGGSSYHYTGSNKKIALLENHFSRWQGTKYKSGGMTRAGVDCSGFSVVTYKKLFGLKLPRTTGEQAVKGKAVSKKALQAGDLVFFKTGMWRKHVGIYLENGRFMHASTSKGVMISNLRDSYWRQSYWKARRL